MKAALSHIVFWIWVLFAVIFYQVQQSTPNLFPLWLNLLIPIPIILLIVETFQEKKRIQEQHLKANQHKDEGKQP